MSDEAVDVSQGFLSYTRDDNNQFGGVVDRLKTELSGWYEARTGRRLELFVDRDSIGWGQDWRREIGDSVRSATVFIPVITMRYFNSPACREELLAFYNNAQRLGVTELILPIILSGSQKIRSDSPREEVQIIESLNYENIENAWNSGYESTEWKRQVSRMVENLETALERAEGQLLKEDAGEPTPSPKSEGEIGETTADFLAMQEKVEEVTADANRVSDTLTAFGEAASRSLSDTDFTTMSPKQRSTKLFQVANDLRAPSEEFSQTASTFEQKVSSLDADLRATVQELNNINHPEATILLQNWADSFSAFEEMADVLAQIQSLGETLRIASLINVNVRNALRPALAGIRSTSNAVKTAQAWNRLVTSNN